jgi:hypothetical protein
MDVIIKYEYEYEYERSSIICVLHHILSESSNQGE